MGGKSALTAGGDLVSYVFVDGVTRVEYEVHPTVISDAGREGVRL